MIQALTLSFQSLYDRRIAAVMVKVMPLGRDLEDMLIARHGKSKGAIKTLPRLMLGLFGTAGMLVAFVNLLAPVLATAMAVHLVHSGNRS